MNLLKKITLSLIVLCSQSAIAQKAVLSPEENPNWWYDSVVVKDKAPEPDLNWVDQTHKYVSGKIQDSADEMNTWFGEPKKNKPAIANLRIIMDNHWNKHDGYSLKPSVSGELKLPTFKERLNLVFGDGNVEDEFNESNELESQQFDNNPFAKKHKDGKKKGFDFKETRNQNASLGLKWLLPKNERKWDRSLGLGLRVNGDIYAKAKAKKSWQHSHNIKSTNEIMYRYGIKSKHYVRNNLTFNYAPIGQPVVSNQLKIEYFHNDDDDDNEYWNWDNTLSRKHRMFNDTWVNYGLYVGGNFEDKKATINSYGPFVGMRANIYRDWLYIQPEISYFNDKSEDRDHHIGVMVRLEAKFN